jgi:hypothetical protein
VKNLGGIKVELTKHRESSPRESRGSNISISMFYSNFSHCEQRDHSLYFPTINIVFIVFSNKPFHVCI